jgi:hypothetical protein
MNFWNIHTIPQIWLPLTSISHPKTQTLPHWSAFFSSNQEAITSVERYFADLKENYRDGVMALDHCWNKCIGLK